MMEGENLYRKRQKHYFLAAAIYAYSLFRVK